MRAGHWRLISRPDRFQGHAAQVALCRSQATCPSLRAHNSHQIAPAAITGYMTGTWALKTAIGVVPHPCSLQTHKSCATANTLAPCRLPPAVVTPYPRSPRPRAARHTRPLLHASCGQSPAHPALAPAPCQRRRHLSDSLSPSSGVPLRPRCH